MGVSQLGGSPSRLVAKSGAIGVLLLPNQTGTGASVGSSDQLYGAWAQMVASTGAEYLLTGLVAFVPGGAANQHGPLFIDLGVGGSGAEQIIASTSVYGAAAQPSSATSNWTGGIRDFPVPLRIPTGTRLSFRAALTVANSSASSVTCIVHAVPYANLE